MLEVDITEGEAPFTSNLKCTGNGSVFEIYLFDEDGNTVEYRQGTPVNGTLSVSYEFEIPGSYTAVCYVDGVTNLECDETIPPQWTNDYGGNLPSKPQLQADISSQATAQFINNYIQGQ